jgi:hypothetical protein
VIYLQNSAVKVECKGRSLKVYGCPMKPKCGNFAFQYDPEDDVWANTVPDDADILLTHGPPFEHLYEGKGCRHLLNEIWRARLKLVVFGHIHEGRGEETVRLGRFQACHENVLIGVSPWVNVFKLIFYAFLQMLSRAIVAANSDPWIYLVNAAMVFGHGNRGRREAITAYI